MDPITLIALAGLGIAYAAYSQDRAARAEAAAREAVVAPPAAEPDLTSSLAAAGPLVALGITSVVSALGERASREAERWDNKERLKQIGLALANYEYADLNGVPDAEVLAPLELAVGVPPCVSLQFTPSWERGATFVALALATRRNELHAPETLEGALPPDPRGTTANALATAGYYRAKGKNVQAAD
ncbi:MAG: hypothetical protein GTN49_07565, partial [candidate division Zixibacteria bacterium]|nr:hypothetical protein [candidate division Zixibacteria bacterium]